MATYAKAAALAALNGLKATKGGQAEVFHQQVRRMGGGGEGLPWHRAYDGKAPPSSMQGPDFVTYAGLTLPKPTKNWDHWYTKAVGSLVWFTLAYHFSLNWGEHWHGDIGYFERDVQQNGYDTEGHGHH